MQRILDPAQIESFAQRSIARIRLPDPATLFSKRAERLRELSQGHALGDYLRLMATVCDAQQAVLTQSASLPPTHDIPWLKVLAGICGSVAASPDTPDPARAACNHVRDLPPAHLEQQGQLLLAARSDGVDAKAAPFIMAAQQVCWVHKVTTMSLDHIKQLAEVHDEATRTNVPGVCPVCGTLPVASIVRADKQYQGYRYLHCALCATEWHLVRVKCSHCLATEGINYNYVEGGSDAIRAESCGNCKTYRKIVYQEKDASVEPVADDLASLALDLLMTAEGYRRTCCNPLLWQPLEA